MSETYQGSALASWTPLWVILGAFVAICAFLFLFGRPRAGRPRFERVLLRIPDGLERLTGIPGWAAATAGLAMYGLLVAGQGFYSDVAWHVALGRDDELFTAPHTAIIVGLVLIASSSMLGVLIATLARVDTPLRLSALRVPWSTLPLAALGGAAVSGFPLDEIWHGTYGIDVTMWSPTHMLMILGASFTGLGIWLVLAEAGVEPRTGGWRRAAHVIGAALTLMGLSAAQGEFAFGVPQYQAIFLPILISLAAGFALVAGRIVHGRWWMLGITVVLFLLQVTELLGDGEGGPVETREGGIYVASALVVELVALTVGTERRLRFALLSGLGIGTIGLAGEWWWNQDAYQPWQTSLLPDAATYGVVAAAGAAVLGTGFANGVLRRPPRAGGLSTVAFVIGGLAVVGSLAVHLDSGVGDVTADVRIVDAASPDPELAHVQVTLDPADAADDHRWFQTMQWQGGGLVASEMIATGEPGTYVSEEPVRLAGIGKVTVRLHRDDEMMLIPVYFPEDPEIDEPEYEAIDRDDVRFESETLWLQREVAGGGSRLLSQLIHGLLALAAVAWAATFALAVRALGQPGQPRTVSQLARMGTPKKTASGAKPSGE